MTDTPAQPPLPERDVPPPSGAPPTDVSPPILPPSESSWIRIIGIIGIVYASLNLLGGVCGLGSSAMMSTFPGMAPDEEPMAELAAMGPWMVLSHVAGMVLAGVLLAGAIGLLKRRPWSRPVLMGWAAASILVAGLGLIITYAIFTSMVTVPPAGVPGTWEIGALTFLVSSICIGIIWSWGPSIFTLVWFSRARIRAEVAGWRVPDASESDS